MVEDGALQSKAGHMVKRDEKHSYNAFTKAQRGERSDELKPHYGGRIMQLQDDSTYAILELHGCNSKMAWMATSRLHGCHLGSWRVKRSIHSREI